MKKILFILILLCPVLCTGLIWFSPCVRIKNNTQDTILVSILWKKEKMGETHVTLKPDSVIYLTYGNGSILLDSSDPDDDMVDPVMFNLRHARGLTFKSTTAETSIVGTKNFYYFIEQEDRIVITSPSDLPRLKENHSKRSQHRKKK